MNVLDWCLVALVGIYALSGYWQGFVTGAFATGGLLLGGLFGVWVAPIALGDADPSLWVSLGALFIVILCASLGQALFQFVGARIRARISWQPIRAVDAVGGAALSAVAVLLVAWALGVAVSGSPDRRRHPHRTRVGRARQGQRGPARPRRPRCSRPSTTSSAPRSSRATSSPSPPSGSSRSSPATAGCSPTPTWSRPQPSVLKVRGTNGCGSGVEGSGFLYSPGRLMTNAHVVAGVTRPEVEIGGSSVAATVVLYDPRYRRGRAGPRTAGCRTWSSTPRPGPRTASPSLGYPAGRPVRRAEPAGSAAEQRLRSPDIYGEGTVIREVFSLRAQIRPGNSGGPIVTSGGDVVGLVFAASVTDQDTGYALTAAQIAESAARGVTTEAPVDTGTACADPGVRR